MIVKVAIIGSIIGLILLECIIALALHFPLLSKLGPDKFHSLVIRIYMDRYRSLIQLEPEYAHYDSDLTYTLKPGVFFFSNIEFKNRFQVNSLGVRDDEDSLNLPDIIVAGDSTAMGCGVDQDETYAQIIEQRTKLKVLNAGVSSYGTVREICILDRIDTENLKYLLIHYDKNDYRENASFHNNNNTLNITDERSYDRIAKRYLIGKRYYVGKYAIFTFKYAAQRLRPYLFNDKKFFENRKLFKEQTKENDVDFFLNALISAGTTELYKVKIVVLGDAEFIPRLRQKIHLKDYPNYISNLIAVDLSNKLTEDCYYILDDHINAKGHKIIAREILKIISEGD
ncbi:MAG: hypothetical protein ISS45_12040 [Candidatus Omnitrophica bacterium]|nr:hypothetical protein [Candidatus Omnitrophota bacterium]